MRCVSIFSRRSSSKPDYTFGLVGQQFHRLHRPRCKRQDLGGVWISKLINNVHTIILRYHTGPQTHQWLHPLFSTFHSNALMHELSCITFSVVTYPRKFNCCKKRSSIGLTIYEELQIFYLAISLEALLLFIIVEMGFCSSHYYNFFLCT